MTAPRSLRILMVAPQPFFRPRGTPFSVLHRIRALASLGHRIDLITYPFGQDVQIDGVRIVRSRRVPFVRDVRIGPSFEKLLLDLPLMWETWRACRAGRYELIHSHEEAAFFCAPLARMYGIPHVYDMHSSLPQQLDNFRSFNLGVFRRAFAALERHVLTTCDGVITICQDLADIATRTAPDKPHAMIENTADDSVVFASDLRTPQELTALPPGRRIILYTGTFEPYQGLDLLLDAFATVCAHDEDAHLVLVGGRPEQVEAKRERAAALGLTGRVTFVGQVHPERIPAFIQAAEIIVSPRSSGTNTPLKLYGYLRSGRPIVATDLPTHTQTLDRSVAELVPATADGLAAGMLRLLRDPEYGRRLAEAAQRLSEAKYSHEAYMRRVADFYDSVLRRLELRTRTMTAPAG